MRLTRRPPWALLSRALLAAFAALASPLAAASCGDDEGEGDGDIASTCDAPNDCYPGIMAEDIQGDITCIDRVEGGYCSHTCQTDANCCAVTGECDDGRPQVCSPFESAGELYCFLSCEDAEVGGLDPNDYCDNYAHRGFQCRSSGGGTANRKVCVPG